MKKNIAQLCTIAGLLFATGITSSCLKDKAYPLYNDAPPATINYNWASLADSLQDKTYTVFSNGKYFNEDNMGNTTFHYWRNAHGLDVLLDGFLRTGNAQYKQRMMTLLNGIKEANGNKWPNDFYDDMEWLALASLRSYEATQESAYLDAANALWTDIKTGRNDNQGDGIAWNKSDRTNKNTPANAPAIIFAARLYRVKKDAADLQIAKELYQWLKGNLVDPTSGIVWDGVKDVQGADNTPPVPVTAKDKYTYNQGTFVGAALELYKVTNDINYLNDAVRTANAVMNDADLSPQGILKNEGNGDGGLFKGILVRYFTLLAQEAAVTPYNKSNLIKFLRNNAQTLYTQGISRPELMVSPDWKSKPGTTTDLSIQLSGVMMIEAAATLNKQGLLN
ncbi:hypothetical protein KHS38_06670 [Mucilaginibacter sp. Bleaf8]|uniref:glycoside hydrolase family 76 protein n=1 Tax=Mucilaginibacter sp. Bleaf8 TaxID=2834430 RepID=UPI001BD1A681|nr:glycoside hydrolase family 76 protein [Mucilaginibacter sp. Bleaf8]MBS7564085.1 hypothetical protein [Mucilaginibacter sp. Bleaf8]